MKLRVVSNATFCNKKQLALNIAEDAKIGTMLIEGNGNNKSKSRRFTLIDGDELETFRVTEDGSVVLAKKLDRETRDRVCFFHFLCYCFIRRALFYHCFLTQP